MPPQGAGATSASRTRSNVIQDGGRKRKLQQYTGPVTSTPPQWRRAWWQVQCSQRTAEDRISTSSNLITSTNYQASDATLWNDSHYNR